MQKKIFSKSFAVISSDIIKKSGLQVDLSENSRHNRLSEMRELSCFILPFWLKIGVKLS